MKRLLKSLGLMGIITAVLIFGTMFWLDFSTCNNCSIEVPDFEDIHMNQLDQVFKKYNLRYEVIDSAYLSHKDPNLVFAQDPEKGTRVKEGRKVYISVTCNNVPQVKFPNLVYQKGKFEDELTLRQARTILQYADLKVGEITTRPDISTNVLEANLNGKPIAAGVMVNRGSEIDLVVGVKSSSKVYDIPDLIGLTVEEAKLALTSVSLNIGQTNYLGSIEDSTKALISRQDPDSTNKSGLNLGHFVDVWLVDYEAFERDTIGN